MIIDTLGQSSRDVEEWDAFVRSQPRWTHFHLGAWRDVLRRVHGHDGVYLTAREPGGTLAGVLPLVDVRSLLFGRYLVSMPFLNHGGPLGSTEAVRALVARAVTEATERRSRLLELRSRGDLPIDLAVSRRKVSVLLPLPESPEALLKSFDGKLRSQVRRAGKDGAVVRHGPDQVEAFFAVYATHMRDLGTPVQSKAFFEAIRDAFGTDAWFCAVFIGDRPVAGGAGFRWGDEFEITWASSLRAYNRLSPNMLLYWAFMERCIIEGVKTFNFGRSTPGAGTHKFKRQWGGEDEALSWYQFSPGASVVAAPPTPTDGKYALGPRVWRHLPERVATALGPRIVRGIP